MDSWTGSEGVVMAVVVPEILNIRLKRPYVLAGFDAAIAAAGDVFSARFYGRGYPDVVMFDVGEYTFRAVIGPDASVVWSPADATETASMPAGWRKRGCADCSTASPFDCVVWDGPRTDAVLFDPVANTFTAEQCYSERDGSQAWRCVGTYPTLRAAIDMLDLRDGVAPARA